MERYASKTILHKIIDTTAAATYEITRLINGLSNGVRA